MRPCDIDGFIEIFGFDHKVSAELLARLGERAIGDQTLAIADLNEVAVATDCRGEVDRNCPFA